MGAAARQDGPGPGAREDSAPADRITRALEDRIAGRAGLEDVRIDVFWSHGRQAVTARIFGSGVGIWKRKRQFHLSNSEVLDILRLLVKAQFGSMPDRFGEDEDDEHHEGPRLKGRLAVHAGAADKSSLQLVDGEQSKAFSRLVEKILAICEVPARRGVSAASMTDALHLLASGTLAPEVLEATFQRRLTRGTGEAAPGWILRLVGREVSDEPVEASRAAAAPAARLELTEKEFRELAGLLASAEPSTMPQSLYAPGYTDLRIEILGYSRAIAGRKFPGMSPGTHGERQAAFDRICSTFETLHDRVRTPRSPGSGPPDTGGP